MRYAIISDIHSNLESLIAVLGKLSSHHVDSLFCLGDIVGYNANPNECVDIVRKEGIRCVLGNHDACACGLEEPDTFSAAARESVLWTREQLTESNRDLLRTLPREIAENNFLMFHGSIHDIHRYIITLHDAEKNIRMMSGLSSQPRIGFFGHTHAPVAFSYSLGKISLEQGEDLSLADAKTYLVNPGSVGQPRDRNPRAGFIVYDTEEKRVVFYRVEYDVKTCQEKVRAAGLPAMLADRLEKGW